MPTTNDILKWSYNNWIQIPELIRNDCINVLRDKTSLMLLNHWKRSFKATKGLGFSPDFHLGVGMQIRNELRTQLLDEELPGVDYVNGITSKRCKNWDDYYLGAIQEFVEQELAKE